MELYIYETPSGYVADFRPYLDGRDHSFDDHRPLPPSDPRWEKINSLLDPIHQDPIGGQLRFVGTSETTWRELMVFPIQWESGFEPVEWESEAESPVD